MSRCYPYPPPGYASSAPLSESIKLQNERDRAKKDRKKEKKRDKKDKKDRSREEKGLLGDKKRDNRKRLRDERSHLEKESTAYPKSKEVEVEQLEKSSLTEELGPPSLLHTCDSPDSSQKSNKRRKHDKSETSQNNPGSALRIRLALVKPMEAVPVVPTEHTFSKHKGALVPLEQSVAKQKDPENPVREQQCISNLVNHQSIPVEKPCFSGRTEATSAQEGIGPADFDLSTFEKYNGTSSSRRKEKKFQKLILNWTPPPILMERLEDDDQDWLFGGTQRMQHERKRSPEKSEHSLGQESNLCSWPPRACYLKEAGVYSLPYVVPF